FFYLLSTYLGISRSGFNGWSPLFCNMAEIICNFLHCPTGLSSSMCKIMTKIVKGYVFYKLPLIDCSFLFQTSEPMVYNCFCYPYRSLRFKNVMTVLFYFSFLYNIKN